MKIAVTRMGALFHYAIPRTIYRLGLLGRFYTDIWSDKPWGRMLNKIPKAVQPGFIKRLAGRRADGLPSELVTDFPLLAVSYRVRGRLARNPAGEIYVHIAAGREFCRRIMRHGLAGCDAVYTSNSQGLELLTHARKRGLRTFSEQTIAPLAFERTLIAEEEERFPGWEAPLAPAREAVENFAEREKQEWEQCDRILCGSEFVRDAIRSVGGPADRCVVVPYGFEFPNRNPEIGDTLYPTTTSSGLRPPSPRSGEGNLHKAEREKNRPLRVLTVGTVCLRKGLPYVAQAAEALQGRMNFRVVGPCRLQGAGLDRLRSVVELLGPVPRSEVQEHFNWADVFLFPSLCEGSATVCYEALASGLPVICTHNTGSVVRDGMEGFLVPIRDAKSIVERLQQLDGDRRLLATMSEAALARCEFFSMDNYAARLKQALTSGLRPLASGS